MGGSPQGIFSAGKDAPNEAIDARRDAGAKMKKPAICGL
jgi:hypothetical protein